VLVLHFADLSQSNIGVAHGAGVTRPMRTILDLLAGGEVPLATLRQALRKGLRRGLIRRSEIADARKHLADSKRLRTIFLGRGRKPTPGRESAQGAAPQQRGAVSLGAAAAELTGPN
jgi:hypothetical protein